MIIVIIGNTTQVNKDLRGPDWLHKFNINSMYVTHMCYFFPNLLSKASHLTVPACLQLNKITIGGWLSTCGA